MADFNEPYAGDDPDKLQTRSLDRATENLSVITNNNHENVENSVTNGSRQTEDKDQELPEPIRDKESRKDMPGLPFINLNQLSVILRDPSMPSQKIMQEVADKMLLKSEESESDDGSVGSTGGVEMKGLLDCIFEVTFQHTDSDNSDDDDDSFERIPREIPCHLCDKIFNSNMSWKTHVLVAHQDPSVLNIRRLSSEVDRKEKSHQVHRKYTKSTSKSDSEIKETKSHHASKSDKKENTEATHEDQNIPTAKKRFSLSRSNQNKIPGEFSCVIPHVERKSQPAEENKSDTSHLRELTKDASPEANAHKSIKVLDHSITTDQFKILETNTSESVPAEGHERLHSQMDGNSGSHGPKQIQDIDHSNKVEKSVIEIEEDSSVITESPTRKRPAPSSSPDSTSIASSTPTTSFNPKRSRKDGDS